MDADALRAKLVALLDGTPWAQRVAEAHNPVVAAEMAADVCRCEAEVEAAKARKAERAAKRWADLADAVTRAVEDAEAHDARR